MPQLNVIIVSTRPGRAGLPVANWFIEKARTHGKFDVQVSDLQQIALPLFDETKHPRFGQYEHEHTRAWSARVKASDAFVFVTPEYNYFSPPSLVNAVDYLFAEWGCKAAGFVSYGGPMGGTRSTLMSKLMLQSLKVVTIPEGVIVPFFAKQILDGVFTPNEIQDKAADVMLDELLRWTSALEPLRR
jgi:NAD(P)H-dependent FMN reductase